MKLRTPTWQAAEDDATAEIEALLTEWGRSDRDELPDARRLARTAIDAAQRRFDDIPRAF